MDDVVHFSARQFEKSPSFYPVMTGITYPSENYCIARSRSDYFSLSCVISGQAELTCNGASHHLEAGMATFLGKTDKYVYKSDSNDPVCKIWIGFQGNLCTELIDYYKLSHQVVYRNKQVLPIFKLFFELCKTNRSRPEYIGTRALPLLTEILSLMTPDSDSVRDGSEPTIAFLVKEYLDLNLTKNLRMDTAAQHVGLSTSHMSRIFKAEYGLTPFTYFTNNRINMSCDLLEATAMSIGEIARYMDYSDEHYFSASFKKATGKSPRKYRALFSADTSDPDFKIRPMTAVQ